MIMVLGSPMKMYSETSPRIIDRNTVRSQMQVKSLEGCGIEIKVTRQSDSNAAYDVVQSRRKRNIV